MINWTISEFCDTYRMMKFVHESESEWMVIEKVDNRTCNLCHKECEVGFLLNKKVFCSKCLDQLAELIQIAIENFRSVN